MSPGTSIQIHVNGESRTVSSGSTVTALLNQLEIRPDRVAVEVNLQIVDRQSFDRQMFQEGDRVEIISFIGGGSGEWVDEDDLRCSRPAHTPKVLAREGARLGWAGEHRPHRGGQSQLSPVLVE
ncbi:MAG: sulfur carrier protein ThiS [Nitrospirales bacterium]